MMLHARTLRPVLLFLALASLAAVLAGPAHGQRVEAEGSERADSLRVYLITIGPGAAVWERFGHNAIWVHDPGAGTDLAYHWGLFDMSEAGFMVEFLQGRMVYSMGRADTRRLLDAYRARGRAATIQELALTVAQAAELQAFVEWNIRPENRRYRYDYFRDNCSTRVRDVLDDALGGLLARELATRPATHTYRSQAVALTAEDVLLTTGMDLGLGPMADQPITRWELAFIPMQLRDDLRGMTVERADGWVPLVVTERRMDPLGPPADEVAEVSPGRRILLHLLAGLLAAGVLVGLTVLADRAREAWVGTVARWTLAGTGSLWGLVVGVLGLVLLGLWTLTDHEFAWRNENLLQVNPVALAFVAAVPMAVVRGGSTWATRVAALLVVLSLLGLVLHPLPVTPQANLAIIGLVLPIHLAWLYVLRRLGRDDGTTPGSASSTPEPTATPGSS